MEAEKLEQIIKKNLFNLKNQRKSDEDKRCICLQTLQLVSGISQISRCSLTCI